jgi:hypothetical protein
MTDNLQKREKRYSTRCYTAILNINLRVISTCQQSKSGIRDQLVDDPAHHRQAQLMDLALLVKLVQALVHDNSSVNETKTKHPKDDTHDEFCQNTRRSGVHERFQAVVIAFQMATIQKYGSLQLSRQKYYLWTFSSQNSWLLTRSSGRSIVEYFSRSRAMSFFAKILKKSSKVSFWMAAALRSVRAICAAFKSTAVTFAPSMR